MFASKGPDIGTGHGRGTGAAVTAVTPDNHSAFSFPTAALLRMPSEPGLPRYSSCRSRTDLAVAIHNPPTFRPRPFPGRIAKPRKPFRCPPLANFPDNINYETDGENVRCGITEIFPFRRRLRWTSLSDRGGWADY
ncbi:hypothetical protein KM043_004589 [Ampulex compressa]|nr:hypothetical protein KM043_004589 [Ampulex compressa]